MTFTNHIIIHQPFFPIPLHFLPSRVARTGAIPWIDQLVARLKSRLGIGLVENYHGRWSARHR